jgi:peptidoglycan/xylan/chitin deacetylase (PgdA/CDA1 family)
MGDTVDGFASPFSLRHLEVDGGQPGAAVVLGAEAARGTICIFLGEDVAASPTLVSAHIAAHARGDPMIGLGRVDIEAPPGSGWYVRAAASASSARTSRIRTDWAAADAKNVSIDGRALRAAIEESRQRFVSSPAPIVEICHGLSCLGFTPLPVVGASGAQQTDPGGRRLLLERMAEGRAHARLAMTQHVMAPRLVGWFTDTTTREVVVRRTLLALHVPPAMVASAGRFLPPQRQKLWFALVSNLAYWSAVRRTLGRAEWKRVARGVPVLLYHAFSKNGEDNRFVVDGRSFARQMRLLSLLRWRVVGYGELARTLQDGGLPPPRTAVLTIDDGYADNADIAAPILERHGFTATIFVVSGRLAATNDWSDAPPLRGRALLSQNQLEQLRARRIELGAHTVTHPSLPELQDDAVALEVQGSRAQLEEVLGEPVQLFAYPYGRLDARAVEAARRAGYVSACTTEPRLARADDDPWRIPRLEVKHGDSLWRFLAKVWLGAQ